MVYVTLTDRIGNNLFQIAAGASLAHINNSECVVYVSDINVPEGIKLNEYIEQFRNNIFRKITFISAIPECTIEYEEPHFEYFPIPFKENIRIKGYFQSEKFFDKEYIRELFSIDQETLSYLMNKYGHLFKEEIISINVRRGDYLSRPLRQPICEMPYFRRSINYFGHSRRFLIISDDIEWCRKKFKGNNFYFIDDEPPIIDLYLQTLCNHNVISNSTFSWWGAWLNPNDSKIVIAPKKWFGIQMNKYNTKDLIPENWVRIKNPRTINLMFKIIIYWSIDFSKRVFWKLTHL